MTNSDKELDEILAKIDRIVGEEEGVSLDYYLKKQNFSLTETKQRLNALIEKKVREAIPDKHFPHDRGNVQSNAFSDGWNSCRKAMIAQLQDNQAKEEK